MKRNKVVICAGGTGGHIYPGLALAQELKRTVPGLKITFFTSGKKIEDEIFSTEDYTRKNIISAPLVRKIGLAPLKALVLISAGFLQSLYLLLASRPDVLVSFGGYSALTAVIAAWLLRIPVVIHEQNVLPGVVNRISERFAKRTAISFEGTKKYFPEGVLTGNPVRPSVLNADRLVARTGLALDGNKKTVIIMGGSQGARSINNAVVDALPFLKDLPVNILHISGPGDHERVRLLTQNHSSGQLKYMLFSYINDITGALAASDLVIGRAGATAMAEIAALNIPSVLIPYPHSAEGHQKYNAKVFADAGAAEIMDDASLSGKTLSDIITELTGSGHKLEQMKKNAAALSKNDAAARLAELINETV